MMQDWVKRIYLYYGKGVKASILYISKHIFSDEVYYVLPYKTFSKNESCFTAQEFINFISK